MSLLIPRYSCSVTFQQTLTPNPWDSRKCWARRASHLIPICSWWRQAIWLEVPSFSGSVPIERSPGFLLESPRKGTKATSPVGSFKVLKFQVSKNPTPKWIRLENTMNQWCFWVRFRKTNKNGSFIWHFWEIKNWWNCRQEPKAS